MDFDEWYITSIDNVYMKWNMIETYLSPSLFLEMLITGATIPLAQLSFQFPVFKQVWRWGAMVNLSSP